MLFISFGFYIQAQYVGIGTSDPNGKLEISHRSNNHPTLLLTDSSQFYNGWIKFKQLNTQHHINILGYGNDFGHSADQKLEIGTDSIFNILSINGTGKVGIGESIPTSKLEVKHNSNTQSKHLSLIETELDYARIGFANSNGQSFQLAATKGSIPSGIQDHFNIYSARNGTDVMSVNGLGDVSFQRSLMPNGNAGTSGQVLKSNGPNASPTWTNAGGGCMQNIARFTGSSTSNAGTPQVWVVPEGTNKIFIEAWGAGGGGYANGDTLTPGGGGGYASGYFNVTPGQSISMNIGGRGNNKTSTSPSSDGGTTYLTIASGSIIVYGGYRGNLINCGQGGYAASSTYAMKFLKGTGGSGNTVISTNEVQSNKNYINYNGARGGDAGNTSNTGAYAGSSVYIRHLVSGSLNPLSFSPGNDANIPGGGGTGYDGAAPGLVIIYY